MAALDKPSVVVNDLAIAIKPNSLKWKEGFGERNARVASAGGNSRKLVTSENVETQKGMVTFVVYTTDEDVANVRRWLANGSANSVQIASAGGTVRTFQNAIVTNDPENDTGVDGEIEVTFESDQAIPG